jgi:hypothetical protein
MYMLAVGVVWEHICILFVNHELIFVITMLLSDSLVLLGT